MKGCILCSTRSSKGQFYFPAHPELNKAWRSFCGPNMITIKNRDRLCYKHFDHTSLQPVIIEKDKFRLRLKMSAIPSLNHNPAYMDANPLVETHDELEENTNEQLIMEVRSSD